MNKSEFKFIILLSSIIVTTNLCAAITGNKTINFWIFAQYYKVLWGIIPFCFANFLLDIFTNQYGLERSKQLILGIIISEIFLGIILNSYVKTLTIPTAVNLYYQNQFDIIIRGLFSGAIATFIAFNVNCNIFSRMLLLLNGKYLWLRCIVATTTGELVFSIVANIIFYMHKISSYEIIAITFNNLSFKIAFEIATLPFTYILVHILEKYETPSTIKFINFN